MHAVQRRKGSSFCTRCRLSASRERDGSNGCPDRRRRVSILMDKSASNILFGGPFLHNLVIELKKIEDPKLSLSLSLLGQDLLPGPLAFLFPHEAVCTSVILPLLFLSLFKSKCPFPVTPLLQRDKLLQDGIRWALIVPHTLVDFSFFQGW